MGYPNQQIGWSREAILLQKILRQLKGITKQFKPAAPTTTTTTTV